MSRPNVAELLGRAISESNRAFADAAKELEAGLKQANEQDRDNREHAAATIRMLQQQAVEREDRIAFLETQHRADQELVADLRMYYDAVEGERQDLSNENGELKRSAAMMRWTVERVEKSRDRIARECWHRKQQNMADEQVIRQQAERITDLEANLGI